MVASVLVVLLLSGLLDAAEIRMVYPRVMKGQDSFRYDVDLDSSFIFGQVIAAPPTAELRANGHSIALEPDGAFLAFLPLPDSNETQSWYLSLIERGDTLAGCDFPFGRDTPAQQLLWMPLPSPQILTVTNQSAHLRTAVGGAYHLFPIQGTNLVAIAEAPGWYKVRIGDGLEDVIDRQFVAIDTASDFHQATVGNASVTHDGALTRIRFLMSGIPLWSEQLSAEGTTLEVLLYDCISSIDRVRYAGESSRRIQDIVWSQQPEGVRIQVRAESPMNYGYRIMATDSTLEILIRDMPRDGLEGKLIVLDPGHGASSDGAIGPRGTLEKDVTLKWARVLAQLLESQGATVALTRERDVEMSLADRVGFARNIGADVMLSLHANALPDGENPVLRRGAGTYYYHSASRMFAEMVHNEILKESRLNDDGIFDANFAVVRPTDFPAILIESAYLMQPEEELLLRDEKFLYRLSNGVCRGLQRYFRELSTR